MAYEFDRTLAHTHAMASGELSNARFVRTIRTVNVCAIVFLVYITQFGCVRYCCLFNDIMAIHSKSLHIFVFWIFYDDITAAYPFYGASPLYGNVRKLLFIGQFDMWTRKVENIEEHIGNQVQTLPFAPYSHARQCLCAIWFRYVDIRNTINYVIICGRRIPYQSRFWTIYFFLLLLA